MKISVQEIIQNSSPRGYTGSQGDTGYTGSQGLGFTGSRGEDGYVGADGAQGYTGSQGEVGYTGSAGAAVLNDLTDVVLTSPSDGQVLKYNGTSWVNSTDLTGSGGGTSFGSATLYQDGTLTVINGTTRWYTVYSIEIGSITARVVTSANDDIDIDIKKNGELAAQISIPPNEYTATINELSLTMIEGDYLTVDVTQVGTAVQPGSDLYVQFKFIYT
jgi:hypothetical protein